MQSKCGNLGLVENLHGVHCDMQLGILFIILLFINVKKIDLFFFIYFRKDLARDLDFRISLRRDEAREQAERHRFEMEMMLDRVTQIPTLFERHSQV